METKKIKDLRPGDYVLINNSYVFKFLGFLNFEKDAVYDMNTEEKLRELLSLECKDHCDLVFKETISRPLRIFRLEKIKDVSPNLDSGIKFVKANPDKSWFFWKRLSANPTITVEDILDNPDKPWDWWYLSANTNITMEFIYQFFKQIIYLRFHFAYNLR